MPSSESQPAFRYTSLAFPVEEIRGVFLFEKEKEPFVASSSPGHLLHLVINGEVRQRCNGREYHLRPGDMLWYHESEFVEGECLRAPWQFYSIIFHAPSLPPPDFSQRLARPDGALELFSGLYQAWHDGKKSDLQRALHCHALLAEILLQHQPVRTSPSRRSSDDWLEQLWWNIENRVRQNLGEVYPLDKLAALGHVSPATLHRACMAAVHMSPVRRIKMLRLEMARGLLIYSRDPIGQIAEKAGYERVNEFSRDIRKAFHAAPSAIRKAIQSS